MASWETFSPGRSGVDSFWIALLAGRQAWIFPNLLAGNHLIDCIALASFTHSHALGHGTVHSFWAKNRHSEKVPPPGHPRGEGGGRGSIHKSLGYNCFYAIAIREKPPHAMTEEVL